MLSKQLNARWNNKKKELNLDFISFCTILMSNDTQSLSMRLVHNQFYFFFSLLCKNIYLYNHIRIYFFIGKILF